MSVRSTIISKRSGFLDVNHTTTISALTRRRFLEQGCIALASPSILSDSARPKRVAGITTAYFHNSHADVILSRILQGENLDYHSRKPDLELVSLYVNQFPANDISRTLAQKHGVKLCHSMEEAITLGGTKLAVD